VQESRSRCVTRADGVCHLDAKARMLARFLVARQPVSASSTSGAHQLQSVIMNQSQPRGEFESVSIFCCCPGGRDFVTSSDMGVSPFRKSFLNSINVHLERLRLRPDVKGVKESDDGIEGTVVSSVWEEVPFAWIGFQDLQNGGKSYVLEMKTLQSIRKYGQYYRPIARPLLFWLNGDSFMSPVGLYHASRRFRIEALSS
jgi:hypothetical protein